jgi:hypothetical protein
MLHQPQKKFTSGEAGMGKHAIFLSRLWNSASKELCTTENL